MRRCISTAMVILLLSANITLSQVNTFPYSESFEQAFTPGSAVTFIPNWTGNEVQNSSRIFQGTDSRTGTNSLNIIPISTFSGEILIALDFTGINNPLLSFYAYSKQNGSGTSTRPVILSFSTSVDGGVKFLDDVRIGDGTTFPNNNGTSYKKYNYELPNQATGQSNVIVKIKAERGAGAGSSAEFVMDDVSIVEQVLPLAVSTSAATSATSLVVTFNQEVTQATAENKVNYQLDNGITVASASRTANNQVTLTTSTMANANYQITVNNVEDAASTTPAINLTSSFSYVQALSVMAVQVLSKNSVEVSFNLDLDQTTTEATSNYTIDNGIGNPTLAQRSVAELNKVVLTLGSDLIENDFVLSVNGVKDVSTLATAASLNSNFSYLPLEVSTVSSLSNTQIEIVFNQNVESSSANLTSNYNLNFGYGVPVSAARNGTEKNRVVLTFTVELANNNYQLTISNVTNESGNASASVLQTDLTNSTQTHYRTLVINEVFADPTGASQPDPQTLPSGTSDEFVELYNAGSKAIDLASFDLTGGTIASYVLQPQAYVILTATSNITDFQSFGNVVGVSSWNTLSNGGEQLLLKDNLGNLVDSVTFSLDWYKEANKSDGGWSIEQVNPNLVCSDINNWQSSTNVQGATPSGQNSVYDITPDSKAPNLLQVIIDNPQQITLIFDEIMDDASLNGAIYSLSDGALVTTKAVNQITRKAVTLDLAAPMISGTVYTVSLTGATDCVGNIIASSSNQFLFDNRPPELQRFVFKDSITIDILFDEKLNESTAETESNFTVNQGLGDPTKALVDSNSEKRIRLEFGTGFSPNTTYQLTYQNLTDSLGNTVVSNSVSFDFVNQVDTVLVVSGQLLDVYFELNVDEATAEQLVNYVVDDNVGNPMTAALDSENPRLVHLVFDTGFAQNKNQYVGFESIRGSDNSYLQLLNTTFVYDTDDPDIDSVVVLDDRRLQVYFDEIIEETSAESVNNYTANNGLGNPSSVSRQANKRSVILQFAQQFEQEIKNRISITGIQDLSANAISTLRSQDFIYDRLAPRLIGIHLASPTKIVVEFSEEVVESVAENNSNYSVNNGIGAPLSAVKSEKSTNTIELTFADLGNNAQNILLISNISDVFQNSLPADLTAFFSTLKPDFGTFTILNDSTLQIQFTKLLAKASAEDIENYGFDNGLSLKSAEQNPTDASIITLNLDGFLKEALNYRLVVQQLSDLNENTSEVISFDFSYNTHIVAIQILNQNTVVLTFDQGLDEALAENTQNYVLNQGFRSPLSAVLSSSNPNEVTLLFNSNFTEGLDYELVVQNLKNTYGEIINSSRHKLNYDLTPPVVIAVNGVYLNEIEVVFNEPLNPTTARTINHYSLHDGIGNPTSAKLVPGSESKVLLTFANPLTNALEYRLMVDRVQDKQGKAINAATFDFTFFSPVTPVFRDLVINEIYFDTELTSSLPNYEFIELYNRGSQNIELRNFMLTDKRDTAVFDSKVLIPGAYLIVTNQSGLASYANFGQTIGLRNFPSLSNTGESIYLLDRNKEIVDSLAYDQTFYNNATKSDGGFSVELINPEKSCYDNSNYAASVAVNGGTPGIQNSVFSTAADVSAPSMSILEVMSTTQLKLTFDEAMTVGSLVPSNFELQNGVIVASVELLDPFGKSIVLNLNQPFVKGYELFLTTTNIADCAGNSLSGNTFSFATGDVPSYHEILITEIMATPTPSKGLPEVEYVEIFNSSTRVLDLGGLFFGDNDSSYELTSRNLMPGAYLVLAGNTAATALASYGDVLPVNSFPTLTIEDEAKIKDADGNIIFEVKYDRSYYQSDIKDDGGYSMEMINPLAPCLDKSNWKASTDASGGTPGIQNSVFSTAADVSAPSMSILEVMSTTHLKLTFDEAMTVGSLVPSNFELQNGVVVASVELLDPFGKSIVLNLNQPFVKGYELFLTTTNIADCAGNSLSGNTFSFATGDVPSYHEILITEIMATPTPSKGLPEVEYVEIFNNSTRVLDLGGLFFGDNDSSYELTSRNLMPGAYLVLAGNTAATALASYGDVLPVNSFPTLTIEDEAKIKDANGNIIFEVKYDRSYYQSDIKDDGGYSMEMINPLASCFDKSNWKASADASGGTPGIQNSVFDTTPDITPPLLVSLIAESDQELKVTFNEAMNKASILNTSFNISGGLGVTSVVLLDDFGKEVLLNLSSLISLGTVYTITLSNVTDCEGNTMSSITESFSLGAAPSFQELIFTEIMANPAPTQGLPIVEYLEVFNGSTKIISMDGLSLSDGSSTTTLGNFNLNPSEYLILTPSTDMGQFSNYGNVLGVSRWPSLNTSGDEVSLKLGNQIIHSVDYSSGWYRSSIKANGGFSLELIDLSYACVEQPNWKASEALLGGTPGAQNSVNGVNPDLIGPQLLNAVALNTNQIQISFNEKLAATSVLASNISISGGISVSSINISSDFKSATLDLGTPLTSNTAYQLSLDNITDCSGNLILSNARQGTVVIAVEADPVDIVINEILFNPRTGGVRFVEIYNQSNKFISLKGWRIEGKTNDRVISTEDVIVPPSAYKTITTDGDILKNQYATTVLSTVFSLSSLPSLPSDRGTVRFFDPNGIIIDEVTYSEDYHSTLLNSVDGVSLERIRFSGTSNDPNNWQSASSHAGFATPGYQNSQSQSQPSGSAALKVEPKAFAPNVAGSANFTTINYEFDNTGNVITVSIFDANGNRIKDLTQNALVGTSGFFRWDGTTNSGVRARLGYYMILFEIIEPSGKVTIKKETVAIGTRF